MGKMQGIVPVALMSACFAAEAQAGLTYNAAFDGDLVNLGTAGGTATLNGDATFDSSTPTGLGSSMKWPSGDNGTYVALPDSAGQFTQPGISSSMTVTAWVNWNTGKWSTVASKGGSWDFMVTGAGRLRTQFSGGNRLSQVTIPAATWTQIAMVVSSGQNYTYYINGTNIGNDGANDGAPFTLDNTSSIRLGAGSSGWDGMQGGSLDDVGLYDSALSDGRIKAIYSLATNASLKYGLADANSLFGVYDAQGGSAMIDGATWTYATGLSVAGGVGVVQQSGSDFYMPLHSDGSGVVSAIPEPTSMAVLGLATMFVMRRRRAM